MRQKHGAIATSHGIQFYNAETFDEVRHELIDEALLKLESHAALVSALEKAKRWHQGDKWRHSDDPEQKGAWNRHMQIIDDALALAKGE